MKDFDKQCETNAAIAEMLAEDRHEVAARLAICRHRHGFYTVRGQRVCRDCGGIQ